MDYNNLNQQWETPISQLNIQQNNQQSLPTQLQRNPFSENLNNNQEVIQQINQQISNEVDKIIDKEEKNNISIILFKYFKLFVLNLIIYLIFSTTFVKNNIGKIFPSITPSDGIIPFYGYIIYGVLYCLITVILIGLTSKYNLL